MKTFKKALCVLLCLLTVFSCTGFAFAAEAVFSAWVFCFLFAINILLTQSNTAQNKAVPSRNHNKQMQNNPIWR